jgi:NAD(P)-dependent dehydrogenase (short-subunit alcohol dehydrogenase family)
MPYQNYRHALSLAQFLPSEDSALNSFTTPFGFTSTAAEVIQDVDLSGRCAIVTGGASGIGIETARALASAGAQVTLAVRRVEAAAAVIDGLRRSTGNEAVEARNLDLSDLRSVKKFAAEWTAPLHILVNNAGIMAVPELEKTPQGFELQFGTNFLGHFALVQGLHKSLAAANGARVVSLSSTGHCFSPVNFDDLNFDFIPYTPFGAYGQSKSANALLAIGITQHWRDEGIFSNALHPGAIATGLQKHTGGLKTPVDRRKTLEQGAATSVLLAASPLVNGISGLFFEDCNEAARVTQRPTDFTGGYAAYAVDPANAKRLWDTSLELIACG